MKCNQCKKGFTFNKDSVRLYYFDKALCFCSKDCYYDYTKQNHPSYWQWMKRYYSLSENQKKKYQTNLRKVENQINKLKKKYGDGNKALHVQHDLIWTKPVKPGNWFSHISEYKSFNDFKRGVINFLKKDTLDSISKDSWNFFCHNDYKRDWQLKQIKAINKVFDGLYGENKVRWGFFEYDDKHPDKYNKFWGPYIVINEESFFLDMPYRYTLHTFIRRRLKR